MRKVSKIIIVLAMIIITFIIIPQNFTMAQDPYLNAIHSNHQLPVPSKNESKINGSSTIKNTQGTTSSQDQSIASWNFGMSNQEIPGKVKNAVGFVIKLLRNLSILLTVLVITILGIKYMIGSVEQKADYKKAYVNIIIGVGIVTMITSIIDVIFSAAQN